MAWTIILEDENKQQLHAASKELDFKALKGINKNNLFKLLKYLDPYGDTTFNSIQIDDLLMDFEVLESFNLDKYLLDEIIAIAIKCKNQPHTYLTFYGD